MIDWIEQIGPAVRIEARSRASEAACPGRGGPSVRVHARYERRVVDAAVAGRRVVIRLRIRRLFCDDRDRRRSARRVEAAGFPREKWLEDFDFGANPNINPATINTLATGAWITAGEPLCLIGDSGTGKSRPLISLGTAAAQQGFRVTVGGS
ncbi:ATP-binding protein [Saccharothrix stipae]